MIKLFSRGSCDFCVLLSVLLLSYLSGLSFLTNTSLTNGNRNRNILKIEIIVPIDFDPFP